MASDTLFDPASANPVLADPVLADPVLADAGLADPVALAQALIRRPSVTPLDAGAMDLAQGWLQALGFTCRRMAFEGVENLYARRGTAGRNLCFAGHLDVVPPGDAAAWRVDPFAGEVRDGVLTGRGAVDMKGAVAAWIAAAARTAARPDATLSLLITGDEEGEAIHGSRRVVEALIAQGERVDHCLVGEPTSARHLGDMLKVGRRGSLNAWIDVQGVQGHAAYPERAANPAPVLIRMLATLEALEIDAPWPGFPPSNLEITQIAMPNPATNVIPAHAAARLNIRFNPAWTGARLSAALERVRADAAATFPGAITLQVRISGEAFHTPADAFTDMVLASVRAVTGRTPEASTTGGTSDARFIRALCPVVEFGLVGASMHKVDEAAPLADLEALTRVYATLIDRYQADASAAAG